MADNQNKEHVSLVICGHVDSGKSTTTGQLIFSLGGINERDMAKLQKEADALGKGSFAFAFYMDQTAEERRRGVTIQCTTKEFFTPTKHYTIIDAPGHRDFLKNFLSGSSQADVAMLMVPADGNFTTSIAKGNLKAGEVQGQTRQHALLLNLLGVKQIVVGVNKMDCDTAGYSEERFIEIKNEMALMLTKVGFKKDFVANNISFLPISGYKGDNLTTVSEKMPWWKGTDITITEGPKKGTKIHVDTLLDVLENVVYLPTRQPDAQLRVPISGVHKIKGVGDVLTGRVEQGTCKTNTEVKFLPTHTKANKCSAKVFTVEMHHKSVPAAGPGMNVGLNVKGLDKANMPKVGDIMVEVKDNSLAPVKSFVAQIKILNHPGQLKVGYSPIAFVRTARSAVRMAKINWSLGKKTGGKKLEGATFLEAGDAAEVVFEPLQPFVVDSFTNCDGLGRVAIMEGNSCVMLGKVLKVEHRAE